MFLSSGDYAKMFTLHKSHKPWLALKRSPATVRGMLRVQKIIATTCAILTSAFSLNNTQLVFDVGTLDIILLLFYFLFAVSKRIMIMCDFSPGGHTVSHLACSRNWKTGLKLYILSREGGSPASLYLPQEKCCYIKCEVSNVWLIYLFLFLLP